MSPTKDMSSKIGTSSSPTVERVIKNNTKVQQPSSTAQAALAKKFTKDPVKQ